MLLASPDTFIDLASLAYNVSTGNYAAARWDAASLMIPGVTGLGALNRAGDALQTVNRLDTFYDAGRTFNSVNNISYTTRYGDDVAQSFSSACRVNSFSADTEIATDEGDKPISQIQIGDYVLAWDEETNSISFYPVTDTIHHTDETIVHLTVDGEELETTPEHPFFVEGEGWVNAEDLQLGNDIRNADGSTGEVEYIEFEQTQQEMYNLTVDEAHTFFVGDGQWLVHNANCDPQVLDYVNQFQQIPGFTIRESEYIRHALSGDMMDPVFRKFSRNTYCHQASLCTTDLIGGAFMMEDSLYRLVPNPSFELFAGVSQLDNITLRAGDLITFSTSRDYVVQHSARVLIPGNIPTFFNKQGTAGLFQATNLYTLLNQLTKGQPRLMQIFRRSFP